MDHNNNGGIKMFEDLIGNTKKIDLTNLIGDYKTTKCVECFGPATCYTGHVLMNDYKTICAGWCEDHVHNRCPDSYGRCGCYGRWRPEYGLQKYGSGVI